MSDQKLKPREKPHYVNNKEFSLAVVEYVREFNEKQAASEPLPKVTDYIASCFMKISEGLSHRPNFIRYTYRDEMVMDAVENCLKAIRNYDITTKTRTGNPNAFSYFTQICFYAFIRRIQKEKKQQDIKMRFIEKMGISDFIEAGMDPDHAQESMAYVDQLRARIDVVKQKDSAVKEFAEKEKSAKQLELFM